MLLLTVLALKGTVGLDLAAFTGTYLTYLSFAQYLIPLAVLELYFLAQDHPGALRRLAMAGMLFVLTLAMAVGLFLVTMGMWVPQVKAAFDPRRPIAEALSATIQVKGVDEAVKQYHALKASAPTTYNFDEDQLNSLGYRLIAVKNFKDAIRILQLNVEVYPKSSNVYDSLGEAYMNAGERALAIANYRKSLELNPKNANGARMLKKLQTP